MLRYCKKATKVEKVSHLFWYFLVKFIYSEKATKFCKIFTFLLICTTSDKSMRWRFCKNLWPSQNIWTLNIKINWKILLWPSQNIWTFIITLKRISSHCVTIFMWRLCDCRQASRQLLFSWSRSFDSIKAYWAVSDSHNDRF